MAAPPNYDLFISYADADRDWVEGYLLDALTHAGVRYHSEAAFALGAPRLLEFERAIQGSQRTLLVLSSAYLADSLTQFADLLAQSYGLETATWPVIPLVLYPVTLPPRLAMLTQLDATEPANWSVVVERLCKEVQRPVPGPAPRPPCPYPGMVPFRVEDARFFFGRDRERRDLLERLRFHPFLAVIGPSGNGKSSLVFAGLIPALRESGLFGAGDWRVQIIRPGARPMEALSAALGSDLTSPAQAVAAAIESVSEARRLLLIVDQFEEVFTVGTSESLPFQDALRLLAAVPDCFVILTIRADFYPDLMTSPLWSQIQAHRVEIVSMDEEGLRQAIVKAAENAGVFVETALVERLIADAAGEPGVLPFIQETLVLLWEHVERRFLPLRAYEALVLPRSAYGTSGQARQTGLHVAMARRADAALTKLSPEQQLIARRIFLRLVQFGEGRADTRRQQPVADLSSITDDPILFEKTLYCLAKKRLLTFSGQEQGADRKVDIAHEALITSWPTLQKWLIEHRELEQTRRWLTAKAGEWVQRGRGKGGLLDLDELADAERWLVSPSAAILGYDAVFSNLVEASRDAIVQAEQTQEATRQRELAQIRALSSTKRQRQIAVVTLATLIGLTLAAALSWAGYREFVRRTTGTPLVVIAGGPARIAAAGLTAEDRGLSERTVAVLPFAIERYEVTHDQYRACAEHGPCTAPLIKTFYDNPALNTHPIVLVSASQAEVYCTWLGRRLPSAAEWERAVRGPPGRPWPWGNDPPMPGQVQLTLDDYPDYQPEGTLPVDSMPGGATVSPEAGIHHLIGNVAEWVVLVARDCEADTCRAHWDGKADRIGLMGGFYSSYLSSVSEVANYSPESSADFYGFRCVADN